MHLLYLDESGNPDDASDRHFVFAGVSAFERNTYCLNQALDNVKHKHFPTSPPIDFHANQIRSGKGFWRDVDREKRQEVIADIGQAICDTYDSVRLFGAVVEKNAALHGEDAVRAAMEQVCKRFDTMLRRRGQEGDSQRGLLVMAESHYQARAKVWVKQFWELGTQWGVLRTLCDIPYFAAAKESRLLQAADYVSHALFLLYERRDDSLARLILRKFDGVDGVLHGLVHLSPGRGTGCECPACASRRIPGTLGAWIR